MHLLDGKTCLVTGGADSIGLAAARLFLDHGARVALVDREPATSENLGDAYDAERMISLTADVSRAADTARYVSDFSSFTTGATLMVDGGMSA